MINTYQSFLNLSKKPRKIRSLSSEHKQKISLANKGKKRLSTTRKTVTITIPTWVFKPVICINTNKRYISLAHAAEEVYKNKQVYPHISNVCKGIKTHYKKLIWRYEKDYLLLSDNEKQALQNKCVALNTPKIKYKTKLFFRDTTYDSFTELGLILFKEGLLSYRNNTGSDLSKILSTMVGKAKRNYCPLLVLNNSYIFFADYEVIYKTPTSTIKIGEKPVTKTVEEIYSCYSSLLNVNIGDIRVLDLLLSTKLIFYKLDGLYFKSKINTKNYAYDKIINKTTLLSLIDNPDYTLLFNKDTCNLTTVTKNNFYIKNHYIFFKKNDYINKFTKEISKKEILLDLNLLYYK